MQTWYWLVLFIIMLIIEIITMGLSTIWFAGGALVACLAGVIGLGTIMQILVFLVVSILFLVMTRPIAVKYFNRDRQKTNAESLIGQQAIVLEDIDTLKAAGRVMVGGLEWAAKTNEPNGKIKKDSVVVVEGIQGVKLIVKEKEE